MKHWFGGIVGSSLMAIVVTCTCGKQFKVKEELAGKRGKCAACGQVLSVPTLASSADQEKATPAPLRACPMCWEALLPKAVICLNCGLDLRTGKQLPQAKSAAPAAPSRPSAKAPASSARLWIALIAGGVCLAGVVAAITLLSWGRGPGISAVAPQPNPGTQNAAPVANAPADAALRKELKNLLRSRERPDANVMLQRGATFTVPEFDGWMESLQSIRPDLDKKQTFFMMWEIDALFKEDGNFLPDDSAKYRRRFKSIPQPVIKTWAANGKNDDVDAAFFMMQIDSLFENDQFQPSRLDSALRILKELKENKDK